MASRFEKWFRYSVGIFGSIIVGLGAAHGDLLREPPPPSTSIPPGSVNLFRGAQASADKVWSNKTPDLAVNGNRDVNDHWAGPPIPATHTIDLGKETTFNTVLMRTWWNGRRYYQYHIEVSTDGKAWKKVVDQGGNTTPAGPQGQVFELDPVAARYVRTTFTRNSENDKAGGHIVEIEGYQLDHRAGGTAGPALAGAVGTVDARYPRDELPALEESRAWSSIAWRGERVHGQFVLWTGTGLRNLTLQATALRGPGDSVIPADDVNPFFVRYTMGAGELRGDILEPARPIDIAPGTTRPVWLSINVPRDVDRGTYRGRLTAGAEGGQEVAFDVELEVLAHMLPPPRDWAFHLDLWQHPWAVARVHDLEPWSPEHWAKLREVLTLAAEAGQKCLTTTIVDRPWGRQTYDAFGSMVKPTRRADGTWSYDYTLFDEYVAFGLSCGIDQQINCYSMVPWGNNLYYHDEASGEYRKLTAAPGTKDYNDYWRPLLQDFTAHLKDKGWFDLTAIAMDERHLEDMENMIALVDSVSPDLKIALAANKNLTSIIDRVHDYSFAFQFAPDENLNRQRAEAKRRTTYYVCCGPVRPNTFPFSPPAESTWLGWRAAAHGYSGLLRWALCSYTKDPFMTTDYPRRSWPTGDCFLIYPGPRSSVRFERLREGIQDYEKIRLLRETLTRQGEAGQAGLEELESILETIRNRNHTKVVQEAKRRLTELARRTP